MDLRNEVLVVAWPERQSSIGDGSLSQLAGGLPCHWGTRNEGTSCMREPQTQPRWNIVDFAGTGLDPIDRSMGLFAVFVHGTASSFLIIENESKPWVDARTRVFLRWAPAEGDIRSNAELRVRRLIRIKAAFGISNSDLARICTVSRTQLYKWLSSDEMVQLTATNWQRLADLEQIAQAWNSLSPRPVRDLLNEKIEGGTTLISLLASRKLDGRAIRAVMEKLAKTVSGRPAHRYEKLREGGIQPKPLTGELAWDD